MTTKPSHYVTLVSHMNKFTVILRNPSKKVLMKYCNGWWRLQQTSDAMSFGWFYTAKAVKKV